MMLNGDYYTLTEAAELIALKTGKKKNAQDVLRNAKKGEIRLCFWFDGTLYKFNYDIKGIGKLQSIDDYKFSGYIQIPEKRITLEGGDIEFGSVTIIEVVGVWAKNRDPRALDDKELSDRYFDKQSESYLPRNLRANLDKALIPEKDLLSFIEKNKAEDTKNNYHIQEPSDQITNKKPISRAGAIGDAIISALKTDGYDPLCLPAYKNGHPGVKANIRKKFRISKNSFDQTWQNLLSKKLISYISE